MRATALFLALSPAVALAQDAEVETTADPELATQEIGVRLGLQAAIADVTPGGLRIAGVHLYRTTDELYIDTELAFSFGSGDATCYYDRDDPPALDCDHGTASGFGILAATGVRYVLPFEAAKFQPYARAGGGLELLHFGGDDLTGIALPLQAGAGGRFFVADRVQVGGEMLLQVGAAYLSRDLGWEPYSALVVQATVDFSL